MGLIGEKGFGTRIELLVLNWEFFRNDFEGFWEISYIYRFYFFGVIFFIAMAFLFWLVEKVVLVRG